MIPVKCPHCEKAVLANDSYAGRTIKCAGCGHWITVPGASASVPDAQKDTKACPFCGEQILAVAKKCKHCGEFLDDSIRAAQGVRVASESPRSGMGTPTTSARPALQSPRPVTPGGIVVPPPSRPPISQGQQKPEIVPALSTKSGFLDCVLGDSSAEPQVVPKTAVQAGSSDDR